MATETTNYKFQKPAENEYYDVGVQNQNWDDADMSLKELDEGKVDSAGGDIAATKVGSITASTASYPVPAANDTVKVGFGKIVKFFGDIRNWMTGVCLIGQIVNNCVTNNAGLPLSAAQGKVLMDLLTKLNSDLRWKQLAELSGFSDTFTLPSIYHEFEITAYAATYDGTITCAYKTIFSNASLNPSRANVIIVGGYYYESADYGTCNINLYPSNEIQLRNFIYAGKNYRSLGYGVTLVIRAR